MENLTIQLVSKTFSYFYPALGDALRDLVPYVQFKSREKHPMDVFRGYRIESH